MLQDDVKSALEYARDTLLEPISIPYARYTIFLCLGNIELAICSGKPERGLSLIDDLLNEVFPLTRVDIPDVLRWEGKALVALGKLEDAHQTLTQARSLAERLGAKSQLWPVLESLADVNEKLGNRAEAKENRETARKLIEEIADSLHEIGLRESFLEKAQVRALMRQ